MDLLLYAISRGSKFSPSWIVVLIDGGNMMNFPLMDSMPLQRIVLIHELSLGWQ